MWAEPPTSQDVWEMAKTIRDYFGTTWDHEVIVHYVLDRAGKAELMLRVVGVPARPGPAFMLCKVNRIVSGSIDNYHDIIQAVVDSKEGYCVEPTLGVRVF